MFKIVVYKEPKPFIVPDFRTIGKRRNVSDQDYKPAISSLRRSKTTVQDIVLCNKFDLFCTFTFDPRKVDRYNFSECSSCMRRWLSHQRERSLKYGRELKYLIIPEQHKDGAWHFHALLSGYSSTLRDTGLKTSQLRTIYNITSFRLGFTTAVKIDSMAGVSTYITKYITKAFVSRYNGKKFFCSVGLKRPVRQVNSPLLRKIIHEAPLFVEKVGETPTQFYYHIDKKNLRTYLRSAESKKNTSCPPLRGVWGVNYSKKIVDNYSTCAINELDKSNVAQYREHDFDYLSKLFN